MEKFMNVFSHPQRWLLAGLFLALWVSVTQAQATFSPSPNRPGSVLFYNIVTSDVTNPHQQNTRLNLTNTNNVSVLVHWFFVDRNSCQVADTFTCLTGNQTFSFLSSDYDPGVTGYAVAVAVNEQGLPRNFNFLLGSEFVKFRTGHQANLVAESVAFVNANRQAIDALGGSNGTQAELLFDDTTYEQLPSSLALSNIPSPVDGNNTLLILNRIGGDLGETVSNIGILNGLLYDQNERGFSFTLRTNGCQLLQTLSDGFPRTVTSFSKVIPAGTSGWMKIFTAEKVESGVDDNPRAILGAMINFHDPGPIVPIGNSARSFQQGHLLHRMNRVPVTRLRVPVLVPPGC